MEIKSLKFDTTINIQNVILVTGAIITGAIAWGNVQGTLQEYGRDISELKGESRPISTRLTAIETQLDYTVKAVDRIDRRMESPR